MVEHMSIALLQPVQAQGTLYISCTGESMQHSESVKQSKGEHLEAANYQLQLASGTETSLQNGMMR